MLWGLVLFWAVGATGAYGYAQYRDIPTEMVLGLLPAFLLEATLFLGFGLERERTRLERLKPWTLALALTVAAVIPYSLATLYLASFSWQSFAILALLAAVVSVWFIVLPHRVGPDLLFLALVGVIAFSRLVRAQYPDLPRLPVGILGQMMWIRTAGCALLCIRQVRGVGFGFWPDARHWKIGALYFLGLILVAIPAAWAVNFGVPHVPSGGWGRSPLLALGTFFGILWVTALGEEFLFRGLLQQWFSAWMKSDGAALLVTSLLFGAMHLWTPRNRFPDWQLAPLAGLAGVFYGLAFRSAKSIRASMVTHALTVTTWRLFFS